MILRDLLLIGFLVFVISGEACVADMARGVVYHDADGNGHRDAGEASLPGVRVSNGLEVVQTDAAGSYELPVDDDTTVFVVKPRDWMTALDDQNIPRFYYIHKPNGSPDAGFLYKGVPPTGALPEAIDFPLTKSPESDRFTVVFIGDPQPYDAQEVRYYANDVLAQLVGTDAKFAVALGDLVGDDLALFEPLNRCQAALGIPVYNVLGNHDQNYHAASDEHASETFQRVYGPTDYAFQYGSVHFILLDNVRWKGYIGNGNNGRPRTGNYNGWLHEHQLEFVANYVATVPTEELIVICTHIPLPLTREGTEQHSTPQYRKLLQILSGHPHTMSLSGHTHVNHHFFAAAEDGYQPDSGTEHHHHNMGTASGSWYRGPRDEQGFPVTPMADGAPNGYFIATFDGNIYRERYKPARMPANYQMVIHTPEVTNTAGGEDAEVLVNVFNGNEKTTVRMRINGGGWMDMSATRQPDPAYAALRQRDREQAGREGRSVLPDPYPTTHMWRANLPAGLAAGVHILEVQATDMFGQTDRSLKLIEVH